MSWSRPLAARVSSQRWGRIGTRRVPRLPRTRPESSTTASGGRDTAAEHGELPLLRADDRRLAPSSLSPRPAPGGDAVLYLTPYRSKGETRTSRHGCYYLKIRGAVNRWEGRRVIGATLPACANPRRRIDGTRVAQTPHPLVTTNPGATLVVLGRSSAPLPESSRVSPRAPGLRPPEESPAFRRGGRGAATLTVWCGRAHREWWWVSPARGRVCVRIALPPSPSSEGAFLPRVDSPAGGAPATTATRCRYYRIPGSVGPLDAR